MATEDTKAPRIYIGPQAVKLATGENGKASTGMLEERLDKLLVSFTAMKKERDTLAEKRDELMTEIEHLRTQSLALTHALGSLESLAMASVERNRIDIDVAKAFDKQHISHGKLLLHVCGLIGIGQTEDAEQDALIKGLYEVQGELAKEIEGRMSKSHQHADLNALETKRLAREINDTRAAVQSSNAQELELATAEKDGFVR